MVRGPGVVLKELRLRCRQLAVEGGPELVPGLDGRLRTTTAPDKSSRKG